jgi:hypothetical protein
VKGLGNPCSVLNVCDPRKIIASAERRCDLFQACKKVRLEPSRIRTRQVTMSTDDQDFKRALVWYVIGEHREHFRTVEHVKDAALSSSTLLTPASHHTTNSSKRGRQPTLDVI